MVGMKRTRYWIRSPVVKAPVFLFWQSNMRDTSSELVPQEDYIWEPLEALKPQRYARHINRYITTRVCVFSTSLKYNNLSVCYTCRKAMF